MKVARGKKNGSYGGVFKGSRRCLAATNFEDAFLASFWETGLFKRSDAIESIKFIKSRSLPLREISIHRTSLKVTLAFLFDRFQRDSNHLVARGRVNNLRVQCKMRIIHRARARARSFRQSIL